MRTDLSLIMIVSLIIILVSAAFNATSNENTYLEARLEMFGIEILELQEELARGTIDCATRMAEMREEHILRLDLKRLEVIKRMLEYLNVENDVGQGLCAGEVEHRKQKIRIRRLKDWP